MSDQFIRWYRARSTREDFLRQAEFFSQRGVHLEHPNYRRGVLLDVDGSDVQLDAAEVAQLVDMKIAAINVEFWLSSDVNLTCNLSWIPLGAEVQMYYLENLTKEQSRIVESVLIDYIHSEVSNTFGFVLDRNGDTAECDWDGFYDEYSLGRPRAVGTFPDILAVTGPLEGIREILGIPESSTLQRFGEALIEVRRVSM